ncbi:MAG: isoleucine--tRNA ligase [Elusimicrobiota bacterium]
MNYNKTLNLPGTEFSMKANLSSREPGIQDMWKKSGVFRALLDKNADMKKFILHDGPPYANGHIHMGHSLNRVLKDIVIKYKAMTGHYTPFIPGWDCHGLPVEFELLKKMGTRTITDKMDFRKKAADYALNFVDIQRKEFMRLGLFGDWENPYLTLHREYEEKIIEIFKELFLRGFITRELKPVYWCGSCNTALAEAEVEYADISSPSVFVRFEMVSAVPDFIEKGSKVYALVWTTTPWTLPSNVALCFHPDHKYSYIGNGTEYLIVAEEFASSYPEYSPAGTVKGRDLEGKEFLPPFSDRRSGGILGDFVTLEDGTGIVHIAPGHGEEDYLAGKKYSLPILSPVDDKGRFTDKAGISEITGKGVFESDPVILEMLKDKGLLFGSEAVVHSYPHCWRCKKPVIFRATEQWFMKVDHNGLRGEILKKIPDVKWFPESAAKRITAMIQNRPDWCLSRQRLWGVPVPVFYCSSCGGILATEESLNSVQKFVKEHGSDGWFKYSAGEILGDGIRCSCGSDDFRKESDILDVWFDSGVSNFAVLETRENHQWPADMYLEGSDQHRGWFQTSMIPAVAVRNIPPYKSVFTHGFIVDAEGKKMSKSVGNVVSPQEVVKEYGADLLRLWVASENYFKDIKISREILEQIVVYYRRIRNTIRFILGNNSDFTDKNRVPYENMTSIDRYILHKLYETISGVSENYENCLFFKSTRMLHDFCNIWLSSFYFNILKDRLYVSAKDSIERRSAQTVLSIILEMLLKYMSPILSHTAEEAWQILKKEQPLSEGEYPESIFLAEMDRPDERWNDPEHALLWDNIVALRTAVLKKIELAKEQELVKDPLESQVEIVSEDKSVLEFLKKNEDNWKEYLIVSNVVIRKGAPGEDAINFLSGSLTIRIKKAEGKKCVRCWLVSEDNGADRGHPDLCGRCTGIVAGIQDE